MCSREARQVYTCPACFYGVLTHRAIPPQPVPGVWDPGLISSDSSSHSFFPHMPWDAGIHAHRTCVAAQWIYVPYVVAVPQMLTCTHMISSSHPPADIADPKLTRFRVDTGYSYVYSYNVCCYTHNIGASQYHVSVCVCICYTVYVSPCTPVPPPSATQLLTHTVHIIYHMDHVTTDYTHAEPRVELLSTPIHPKIRPRYLDPESGSRVPARIPQNGVHFGGVFWYIFTRVLNIRIS